MLYRNPRAVRLPYPDELRAIMNMQRAHEGRAWLARWGRLNAGATPLRTLPDLAARLGLGAVYVKDEAARSSLGSFKVLGAPLALVRLILRLFPQQNFRPEALLAGDYAAALQGLTVITATDGNHGRSLAAAAQSVGCGCVIVLHARVSREREAAIAACGARIVRIAGNYDDSVREAARLAAENGWQVVSDTSYSGHEEIARDVMQGYAILPAEIAEQAPALRFSHVFLQAGVGALPAGVAAYWWEQYGAQRPELVIVEPQQADCLLQSARAGEAAATRGSVDSVMAGLACGEASPLAWRFLRESAQWFLTVEDDDAVQAMRLFARGSAAGGDVPPTFAPAASASVTHCPPKEGCRPPLGGHAAGGDVPIVSGESGAAGLAGLLALCRTPEDARSVGLDEHARVLLINTEGATAPSVYQQLTGEAPEAVLSRQQRALAAR